MLRSGVYKLCPTDATYDSRSYKGCMTRNQGGACLSLTVVASLADMLAPQHLGQASILISSITPANYIHKPHASFSTVLHSLLALLR
jgi:hypothetical protein